MTTYWVRVRYRTTGLEAVLAYGADVTRQMAIILLSPYVDVLEEGSR